MSILEETSAEAGGLRERKKLQTRRAIHGAAVALVLEQGLDATTIEQICEAADVSPRTFFNYFPSKSAAVLALPEAVVTEAAADRFRASTGPLVAELAELVGSEFAVGDPDRRRVKALLVDHPELRQPFQQWMGGLRERIVALAEERLGSREDAVLVTAFVLAAIGLVVHDGEDSDEPVGARVQALVARFARLAGESTLSA